MNFGLTTGMTVSGFHEDTKQVFGPVIGTGLISREVTENYKPVFDYSGGVFGEVSYKNFALKFGGNALHLGESKQTHTRIEFETTGVTETRTFRHIRMEYLQIPIELEIRFKIFNVHPFLTFGISQAFYMNDYIHLRTIENFGNQTVTEGSFNQIHEDFPFLFGGGHSINRHDNTYIFGGGFYLNSRMSLSAWYAKGKQQVFCSEGSFDRLFVGNICTPFFSTKTIMIQLQYRLFKKDLNDVIKFKKKQKEEGFDEEPGA